MLAPPWIPVAPPGHSTGQLNTITERAPLPLQHHESAKQRRVADSSVGDGAPAARRRPVLRRLRFEKREGMVLVEADLTDVENS